MCILQLKHHPVPETNKQSVLVHCNILALEYQPPMPFTSMHTRGSRWSLNGVLARPVPYTVYTMQYQWCTHHTPCIFETPPSIRGKQAGYSSSSLQWLSCVDYQTPCILTSRWSLSGVFRTIYSVQYSDVHCSSQHHSVRARVSKQSTLVRHANHQTKIVKTNE